MNIRSHSPSYKTAHHRNFYDYYSIIWALDRNSNVNIFLAGMKRQKPMRLYKKSARRGTESHPSIINQSIIIWTPKTKSLLPSLYKRSRLSRDLAKRGRSTGLTAMSLSNGEGRFSEAYVFFIMDSLVTHFHNSQ